MTTPHALASEPIDPELIEDYARRGPAHPQSRTGGRPPCGSPVSTTASKLGAICRWLTGSLNRL